MRLLDAFRGMGKRGRDFGELRGLYARLQKHTEDAEDLRNALCLRVLRDVFPLSQTGQLSPLAQAALLCCHTLLAYEGHLYIPEITPGKQLHDSEVWELTARIKRALVPFEHPERSEIIARALRTVIADIVGNLPLLPDGSEDEWASLTVPLHTLLPNPAAVIEAVVRMPYTEELIQTGFLENLRRIIALNVYGASGIDPATARTSTKPFLMPLKTNMPTDALISTYLSGTPFAQLLTAPVPFAIPVRARFEHTHILGGS